MSAGGDLRRAGLLLIDAAVVAAGTAVGLLGINPWLAVPVGLAAYVGLYLAAVAVLRGRGRHPTR
jgi:uncharacterized membrane protein YczE